MLTQTNPNHQPVGGMETIASIASVKYQVWHLEHFEGHQGNVEQGAWRDQGMFWNLVGQKSLGVALAKSMGNLNFHKVQLIIYHTNAINSTGKW